MKKNLSAVVVLLFGLLVFVSSCVKDTFTEKDAYTEQQKLAMLNDSIQKSQALLLDSLKKEGGVINYSVAAVLASDASWLSHSSKGSQQLDQVKVTISQYGKIVSVTTDASGIASFKDLRIGTVNVNVSKTGYTEVDFIATLPALPDSTTVYAYNIVRNVGTIVPVFSLTTNLSTISGIATVETDLTNDVPEVAANVDIIGTIDVDNSAFHRYLYYPGADIGFDNGMKWWNFDYYGTIKQIAFHSTISKATTAADGSFSLKVPSTPDGLPIKIFASEFAATQKLLQPTLNNAIVWGVQSVRTLFGPPVDFTYSSIPVIGTQPFDVQSAYVQFSAPTGTPAAQPTITATAIAVISSSGIISINITNPGEGYTQPPLVIIAKGTAFNSVQAEGTAVISGGRVIGITITYAGTGYKPGDTPAITFASGIAQAANATPKIGFSLSNIAVTAAGSGYTSAPAVTITSNTGTGATATANISGYVSALTLTDPGSGYTAVPNVTISAGAGVIATATANMTTSNPVNSVFVPTNLNFWTTKRLGTLVTGTGSGALTDSTNLSTLGRISTIPITNAGAGYITAPTVTITGGNGFGAVAHAAIGVGGIVTSITIDNRGQGYTTNPTISLTPAPSGGTNATAGVTREFQVVSVNVTASGNGYVAGAAVQFENAPGSGVFIAAPVGVVATLSMGISSLSIGTAGNEYTSAPTVTITPSNGVVTTPAVATASILYFVKSITVTAQGSGYEGTDVTVSIAAPPVGGTQSTAGTVTRINGVLKRLILNTPGVGYTAAPNVYLAVNPLGVLPVSQAQITATFAAANGGQVSGLTIADPGAGYDYASDNLGYYTVVFSTYSVAASATAQANPKSGQIDYITISNPGAGYSVIPTVEIVNSTGTADANGFGKGAVAAAVVTDGRVSGITITNAGSGYYVVPTIRITLPFALVKAVGMCYVDEIGRITGVSFPSWWGVPYPAYTNGDGYITPPTVTFFPSVPGKGAGATGVAIISNGEVVDVVMTNQGSGYTGKNNPTSMKDFMITPANDAILATAGKTYIRDVYFGTGKRMTEEDYSWYGW